MHMDDNAIKVLFDYTTIKGEVPGVRMYSSVKKWLKSGNITFREIDKELYWSKVCPGGFVIFHTDREYRLK